MSIPSIQAEVRSASGKGHARKLRASGKIPAVAYGRGEPVNLIIDPAEIERLHRGDLGWNQPVSLEIEGSENIDLVILKEVQRHPVSRRFLHVDFAWVDPDLELAIQIRVLPQGQAKGMALGGLLQQTRRVVKVWCKPADIPRGIEVDISELEIGDKVLSSELALPDGVKLGIEGDVPVLSIKGKRGGGKTTEGTEEEA